VSPAEEALPRISGRRLLIPMVVAIAFLMEQIDSTVITTALPDMALSLHTTPVRLNLVITSYVLSLAVFIPISGWIADRFGTRRVFAASLVLFTIGSVLCGMAQTTGVMVAMRVLQGIGGAMMTPVGRLILLQTFPKRELATAMSYMSLPILVGPTLGPLIGGFITTYFSWRWIFYVNVPVGVAGLAAALLLVPDRRGEQQPRFDLVGFVISGLGLVLLQFVLENIGRGEVALRWQVAMAVAGAAALVGYGLYARGRANAALDLTLFRNRAFRAGALTGGLARIGLNSSPFLLPLLFQVGLGYSPLQSGLMTFASALGAMTVKAVSVRVLRWFGFDRVLVANSLIGAAAIAGFASFGAGVPHLVMLAYIFGFGMIRSVQFTASNALSFSEIPRERMSRCVSLASVVQQLTMGFGVSVSATVLNLITPSGHPPAMADFRMAFTIMAVLPLVSTIGFIELRPEDGVAVSGHLRRPAERSV
jgi:EmrB/QacA subfamily drug resistance transporter